MRFRLTPRWMKLDDLELMQGLILAEVHVISELWEPTEQRLHE